MLMTMIKNFNQMIFFSLRVLIRGIFLKRKNMILLLVITFVTF